MPYHVEIDEAVVLSYLQAPDRGLAKADIETLLDFLEGLAHTGEVYCNELSRRLSPGSPNFEVTYIFQDAAGRLRNFRFIIFDATVYGVLRVRFVEEL